METKLKGLTDKLYEEGLVRGREQADALVAAAEERAGQIVGEAGREADRIVEQARRAADDLRSNAEAELAIAGRRIIAELRTSVAEAIAARSIDRPVREALLDAEFVKQLLTAAVGRWNAAGGDASLRALLPADMESQLDGRFRESVDKILGGGVEIGFSGDVKAGFRIGPREGGYYIGFTEADFDALLREHLKEKISGILFAPQP